MMHTTTMHPSRSHSIRLSAIVFSTVCCFLSACVNNQKTSDQALIKPWLGRRWITTKTTSLNHLWAVAHSDAQNFRGQVQEYFYYPEGVTFEITGIDVNRSGFSGYHIILIARASAIAGSKEVHMHSRSWAPSSWKSLSFEQQLQPENFSKFFINNPNFRLIGD